MPLPSGTVTFLFTDIEGSTQLLHRLGDRYADALAEHHSVMLAAFTRHGGVEVGALGQPFPAALLSGFADADFEAIGAPPPALSRALYDEHLEAARRGAGPTAWDEAMGKGRSLTLDDALDVARKALRS